MLLSQGWPDVKGAATKVSKHLGVPDRTIVRWAKKESNPPPDKVVGIKKRDMIAELEELRFLLLADMKESYQDAPFNHQATAYGILTDKQRLLEGKSTDNNAVQIKIGYGDASVEND